MTQPTADARLALTRLAEDEVIFRDSVFEFADREIRPLVRVARPHEPLWRWPQSFFEHHVPLLVDRGFLTQAEADEFTEDFATYTRDPNAYFVSPVLGDLIASRRA